MLQKQMQTKQNKTKNKTVLSNIKKINRRLTGFGVSKFKTES